MGRTSLSKDFRQVDIWVDCGEHLGAEGNSGGGLVEIPADRRRREEQQNASSIFDV
jgi:hypothetical protein